MKSVSRLICCFCRSKQSQEDDFDPRLPATVPEVNRLRAVVHVMQSYVDNFGNSPEFFANLFRTQGDAQRQHFLLNELTKISEFDDAVDWLRANIQQQIDQAPDEAHIHGIRRNEMAAINGMLKIRLSLLPFTLLSVELMSKLRSSVELEDGADQVFERLEKLIEDAETCRLFYKLTGELVEYIYKVTKAEYTEMRIEHVPVSIGLTLVVGKLEGMQQIMKIGMISKPDCFFIHMINNGALFHETVVQRLEDVNIDGRQAHSSLIELEEEKCKKQIGTRESRQLLHQSLASLKHESLSHAIDAMQMEDLERNSAAISIVKSERDKKSDI